MRDEVAALCYISNGGFSYGDVMEMTSRDRRFYLRKLTDYKRAESDAMERARSSAKARRRR